MIVPGGASDRAARLAAERAALAHWDETGGTAQACQRPDAE
jgi:hypothetical protein